MYLMISFTIYYLALLGCPAVALSDAACDSSPFSAQSACLIQYRHVTRDATNATGHAGEHLLHKDYGDIAGIVVLGFSFASLLSLIFFGILERRRYTVQHHEEKTFEEYLWHRFVHWYQTSSYSAVVILVMVLMALLDVGVLAYWAFLGVPPWRMLYNTFSWFTGGDIMGETSTGGRIVAIFVSIGGMITFGLLLSVVQHAFETLINSIEVGRTVIVEENHVVVINYTPCTHTLLHELAEAHESQGGAVLAVLDSCPRCDIVNVIRENVDLRSSVLIVRSGIADLRDLSMLAVESAKAVVLLADVKVSREEADAKTMCVIMALKKHGWPRNGYVVAQCCVPANNPMMQSLYPGKIEVVVVSDLIADFMVKSAFALSLSGLIHALASFEGCEFYFKEWPELVGESFQEIIVRFPNATPVGVCSLKQGVILAPPLSYILAPGDEVIVIATAENSYSPSSEAYFTRCLLDAGLQDEGSWHLNRQRHSQSEIVTCKPSGSPLKILITGWSDLIGSLLFRLNKSVPRGSEVDIYSPRPVEERGTTVTLIQKRRNYMFDNIAIKQLAVELKEFIAMHAINELPLESYDVMFVLADLELMKTPRFTDEVNVGLIMKMRRVLKDRVGGRATIHPITQVCEERAATQLSEYGLCNNFNITKLSATMLAQQVSNRKLNGIFSDLLCVDGEGADLIVRPLTDLFHPGAAIPDSVSFGELLAISNSATADCTRIVIAWTRSSPEHEGDKRTIEWEVNPEDKTTRRPWSSEDLLALIENYDAGMAS